MGLPYFLQAGLPYSLPAGLPYSLQAGLPSSLQEGAVSELAQASPRAVAGLGEPRTTAGWFWLGAGNSPDTGGSPPSSIVPWCLGGPRDNGNWPHARTERGWWRHLTPSPRQAHRTPANTREREISVGKGDEAGSDFHHRGSKKNRKQKTFQNGRKNKNGWKWRRGNCKVQSSVTLTWEQGNKEAKSCFQT